MLPGSLKMIWRAFPAATFRCLSSVTIFEVRMRCTFSFTNSISAYKASGACMLVAKTSSHSYFLSLKNYITPSIDCDHWHWITPWFPTPEHLYWHAFLNKYIQALNWVSFCFCSLAWFLRGDWSVRPVIISSISALGGLRRPRPSDIFSSHSLIYPSWRLMCGFYFCCKRFNRETSTASDSTLLKARKHMRKSCV